MLGIIKPYHGSAITGRERDLIVGYEMDPIEGVLINKEVTGAAGGSDGTVTGSPTTIRDAVHGPMLGQSLGGGEYVAYTQTGDVHTAGTMRIAIRPRTLTAATDYYIHAAENTERFNIYFNGVDLMTRFGDAAAQDSGYNGAAGKSARLVVSWDATDAIVYVDGVAVDTYAAATANDFANGYIGCDTGLANEFDGEYGEFLLDRRQLSAAEVQADYNEYAQRAKYQDTLRPIAETSTSTVTGPIGGSLWTATNPFASTLLDIEASPTLEALSGVKGAKCLAASGRCELYIPMTDLGMTLADPEAAYGTWDFWVYRTAGNEQNIYFVASTTDSGTTVGYNIRMNAGDNFFLFEGGGNLFYSSAGYTPTDEWVHVTVARRQTDGRFTVCMNDVLVVAGGGGTNPIVGVATTAGSYLLAELYGGDKMGLFSHRAGECT